MPSSFPSIVRSLLIACLGAALVVGALVYRELTDSSYIYSGDYSNEEYGFAFSNFPEGWTLEPVTTERSYWGPPLVAEFTLGGAVHEDVLFSVYVTDAEPEFSDIAYLGHSDQYFFYYSFLRFPFECSTYDVDEEDDTRERCEAVEGAWNMLEKGVLPSFSVKDVSKDFHV